MKQAEFLRIAELAALRMPDDPAETESLLRARMMLRTFASRVSGGAAATGPPAPDGGPAEARPPCRLRADEPGGGLPEGAVAAAAPEHGDRLVQVPRVL